MRAKRMQIQKFLQGQEQAREVATGELWKAQHYATKIVSLPRPVKSPGHDEIQDLIQAVAGCCCLDVTAPQDLPKKLP